MLPSNRERLVDAAAGFAVAFGKAQYLTGTRAPCPHAPMTATFRPGLPLSFGFGDPALVLRPPVTCPARHLLMVLRGRGGDERQHDRDSGTEKSIAIDTQSVAQPQDCLALPGFQACDPGLDCHLARCRKLTDSHDDDLAVVLAGTSANSRVKKRIWMAFRGSSQKPR